jgi:hypothetical protein
LRSLSADHAETGAASSPASATPAIRRRFIS